jgi:putative CocE/NonD family hydrolase
MAHVIVERNVWIPMRDGVRLQADIWRPDDSATHPALLQRTPYDRSDSFAIILNAGIEPLRAVQDGFVVVVQDTRGRFGSEGHFVPFINEGADGFDTVQWLAEQRWSNGRVGMYGASYYAATQLLAAIEQPPALKAIAPQITTSEYYENWIYQGGALQVGFALFWALGLAASELTRRQAAGEDLSVEAAALRPLLADPHAAFRARPLDGLAVASMLPAWGEWLRHPDRDDYWVARSVSEHFDRIDVPALHVSGWFDLFHRGTIENFRGLTARGVAEQSIIIGPWAHAVAYDALGEVDFGGAAAAAALDMTRIQLDWFRRFLTDEPEDPRRAPVTVFVMGANVWRDETAWPPERATLTTFTFGVADDGTGTLRRGGPAEGGWRSFDFDPADPVPTLGGGTLLPGAYTSLNSGPRDQRPIEARADVLVYTGETLDADFELCGDVQVTLWAATSAADTDWTAKLVDVHPDGRAISVCDGIVRARYRSGTSAARMLESNSPHEFVLDLGTTAILIPAGHALRVEISSSNFPRFDVNPNHGGDIASATEADYQVAHQRVLHGVDHPSRLQVFTVDARQHQEPTT